MPRPEKAQAVERIKERFAASSTSFLTEYRGLTVAQQQELRRSLREAGARYKVLKMSLTRRALNDLGQHGLDEWLKGPTAVAFVEEDDPVRAARALVEFSKEHESFVIKAGLLNGQVIEAVKVAALAEVEDRPVLLAKLAGAFRGPMSRAAFLMGSFTREAASVFAQLLERKEEAAGVAGGAEEEASAGSGPEAEKQEE